MKRELTAAEWMCEFMCPEPELECPEGEYEEEFDDDYLDEDDDYDEEQAELDAISDMAYDDYVTRELGVW